MSDGVIVAIISGVLTLVGTIITVLVGNSKTNENIRINQAVTDTKLDALTNEVKQHNNFAQRMPVVEEQIKVINHRIDDLEHAKGA